MGLLKIKRKGEEKAIHDPHLAEIAVLSKDELGISLQAAQRIQTLLEEKGQKNWFLRVGIKGGGCSGLTIHYEFCESSQPNDSVFTNHGAKVCIDVKSLSVLGGATLHFREIRAVGEFMLVNNPAAKQCSCGQSFTL